MEENILEEDVFKKIENAIEKGESTLELYFIEMKELPVKEISKIPGLKNLLIGNCKLEHLPPEIEKIQTLEQLDISHNLLTSLPPEIGKIRNLKFLRVDSNRLLTLPEEIGQLENLESLILFSNQLSMLPATIGKLRKLKYLRADLNQIHNLPSEIGLLKNLQFLTLQNNSVTALPKDIGKLKNLIEIQAALNKIIDLPPELLNLTNLKLLDLRRNHLHLPPEIENSFREPAKILNYYFETRRDSPKKLRESKLIIVGQGSVGKTSVIQRLIWGNFNPAEFKTEGISIRHWEVSNKFDIGDSQSKIKINIWDFGGQEIMNATHQFFLTKRSLYLLVLDSRLTQEENRVEYWLKIVQSFGDESPVLIVGNKIDQHPLDIDRTGLQKKYPNIVGIIETSAATGVGIEKLKTFITDQVNNLPHVRDLLPETWATVKTKLEALGQEQNFISHDKYLELCTQSGVSDEFNKRMLISFLNDLGVVLHFQNDRHLAELGILNPQWVTNGVYKILNDKTLFANKGVLTMQLLDEILNSPEYPQNKRFFIVEMMRKFELCYDIDHDNFLIPDLLPKDEPEFIFHGVPAFEYIYSVLPSIVITRFIVRSNQHIHNSLVWRTGVLLKIGENTALVRADIEDRKITIAIDGLEHTRRDALSAIRYQLDEIHGSIRGLGAQKRVPIPEAPSAESLDYDYLLQLERDGDLKVLPVKDGGRLVKVNIRQLLSGIESEAKRKETGGNVTNIYIGGNVNEGNIIVGDENETRINKIDVDNSANDLFTHEPDIK